MVVGIESHRLIVVLVILHETNSRMTWNKKTKIEFQFNKTKHLLALTWLFAPKLRYFFTMAKFCNTIRTKSFDEAINVFVTHCQSETISSSSTSYCRFKLNKDKCMHNNGISVCIFQCPNVIWETVKKKKKKSSSNRNIHY